jgi:hypothetical protein
MLLRQVSHACSVTIDRARTSATYPFPGGDDFMRSMYAQSRPLYIDRRRELLPTFSPAHDFVAASLRNMAGELLIVDVEAPCTYKVTPSSPLT